MELCRHVYLPSLNADLQATKRGSMSAPLDSSHHHHHHNLVTTLRV